MVTQKEKLTKVSQPGARFSRIDATSLGSKPVMGALVLMVLIFVLAPLIVSYSSEEIFTKWTAPSGEHLFGTDRVGRDILNRALYGGRSSLMIGLFSALIILFFSTIISSVAVAVRKSISEAIMRTFDIVMVVLGIAMAAVSVLVPGCALRKAGNVSALVFVIVCSIAFVYTPQLSRIIRVNVIAAYGEDYVRVVVVAGARAPWILVKHVMRNATVPILVSAIAPVADAIILEASLTFADSGLQATTVLTWGNIPSETSSNLSVMLGYWWIVLFPGIFIIVTVLCLNILSEGITDAMVAAPKGPAVVQVSSGAQREVDRLLFDPRRAYVKQAESLQARLDVLGKVEFACDDCFESTSTEASLLKVKDLCTKFDNRGDVNIVDHVSLSVRPGETVDLVGESDCGKSITSLLIMGLINPKSILSDEILYQGRNLFDMSPDERQKLLGREMAMIYQNALSSFNLAMLIKTQMKQLISRGGTRLTEELLGLVGLDPKCTLESYPYELSGGQRQRVLTAMVLTRDPRLVIADRPITALDVTVQKQVIKFLNELCKKLGFAMIFMSHDTALVAGVAHLIAVMYAGQAVEQGPTSELPGHPTHKYARGLLGVVLSIEASSGRLHQALGVVPSPRDFPKGDRLMSRFSHPDHDLDVRPVLTGVSPGHVYAALPPCLEGDEAPRSIEEEN